MTNKSPLVLAVDDTPENIDVLVGLLAPNYRIKVATSGERALSLAASSDTPDLILLDIMMPGMDGFEVCRRLKEDENLKDVPVIFISALERVEDKIRAFSSGGVDYITKPFQADEVEARVATHLEVRRMQKQPEEHNVRLDELVRQKTQELSDAHDRLKMADQSKNEFLNLISHELRTPANGVFGIADLIFDGCADSPDVIELRPMFDESKDRMLSTIDDALFLAQIDVAQESFQSEQIPLNGLLRDAHNAAAQLSQDHGITFGALPDFNVQVLADEKSLGIALTSLLQTTAAFATSDQAVGINYSEDDEHAILTFEGRGKSLDQGSVAGFFDVFSDVRSRTAAEALGLKPAVAERIIAIYGGEVEIKNLEPVGNELKLSIKKA